MLAFRWNRWKSLKTLQYLRQTFRGAVSLHPETEKKTQSLHLTSHNVFMEVAAR